MAEAESLRQDEQPEVLGDVQEDEDTWDAPFVNKDGDNAWGEDVENASFIMKDGELVWSFGEKPKPTINEVALENDSDWTHFTSWYESQSEKNGFREKVEISDITEPRVVNVIRWEDEDHPLEEWIEMCICTFDDLAPEDLVAHARTLVAKALEVGYNEEDAHVPEAHIVAVEACIDKMRKFFSERIDLESAFFKGKFKRDCDYISPQADEFMGEQFRVRISKGGLAVATHVSDGQDIRIKFRNVRKLAKVDKHTLLTAKVKKRMKDATSKEELQALLDFVRTIEPEEEDKDEYKKEFYDRKETWIVEIEELLRSEDIPDKPEEKPKENWDDE